MTPPAPLWQQWVAAAARTLGEADLLAVPPRLDAVETVFLLTSPWVLAADLDSAGTGAAPDLLARLNAVWHWLVGAGILALDILATLHAILYKRDSRAAILWAGFIWLAPFFGGFIYLLLGVNRVRRRAVSLRGEHGRTPGGAGVGAGGGAPSPDGLARALEPGHGHLAMLARVVDNLTPRRLQEGNHLEILINGDEALPAMLAAIEGAAVSVTLATYIFENSPLGLRFVEALAAARARGVEVRVLIDGASIHYSFPSVARHLRRAKVPVRIFLPTLSPRRFFLMNLRNHRKILVVDGTVAFTGGLNLREGNLVKEKPRRPIQDLHFRVTGPAVGHVQEVFAEDWTFVGGDELQGEAWFPRIGRAGTSVARGIPDGPDLHFESLRLTLEAAVACARSSVRIVTPYFVPDQSLLTTLGLAALRGVNVEIILPEKNNLPVVAWAAAAQLWQVLRRGCRVLLTPPPFDHSKVLLVDGAWALVGSTNWDSRSLRLNFEFNLEVYDRGFAARLAGVVDRKLAGARELTLADVEGRSFPTKVRDGLARLLTPYL